VKVISGDEKGVSIERLDNGGKLFIRWELLRNEDARRLRIGFGLEDDNSGADLIMAGHRVHVKKGNYYDGLVLANPSQDRVIILQQSGELNLPRTSILRIEERQVSSFDVYTPEELYKPRFDESGPEDDDVEANFEMAKWATKIGVYHEALIHYAKITETDPEFNKAFVANQIARLEVLDRNKEILNAIRAAEKEGYAHKYSTCLSYFDEILAAPGLDKALQKVVEKKKKKFIRRREKHFTRIVILDYHREVNKRIKAIATNKDIRSKDEEKQLTVDKAMQMIRSKLHKEIVKDIAAKYELDEKKEVEKWWDERKARFRKTASYGSGAFIVDGGRRANKGGAGAAGGALSDYIKRLKGNNKNNPGGNAAPEVKLITKDQWWLKADSIQRMFFLRAFYAEKSGKMIVDSTSLRPCGTCGSTGSIKKLGAQGGFVKVTCPRCQGLRGDKVVHYH
jgi:hypothetical protein